MRALAVALYVAAALALIVLVNLAVDDGPADLVINGAPQ